MKKKASKNIDIFNELNSFVSNIVSESYQTDMVYYTVLFKLAESNDVKVFKEYENAFRVEGIIKNVVNFFKALPKKEMPLIFNPIYCLRESLLKLNIDEKYQDQPENGTHTYDNETKIVADGRWQDFIKTPEIHEKVIEIAPVDLAAMVKEFSKDEAHSADDLIDVVFEFNCEKRANLVYGDTTDAQDIEPTDSNEQ